jgi:tetratricopeptide (TPR) repeat protein
MIIQKDTVGRAFVWQCLAVFLAIVLTGCRQSQPPPPLPPLENVEPQVEAAVCAACQQLATDTDSAEAWGRYAMVLDVHDIAEPALQAYSRACELAPGEFRWWYYRANRLSRTDPEAAAEMFEKAKGFRPDYAALYVRYGRALEQLGKYDEAMALFQRSTELDPESALAFAGVGRLHLAEGRVEAAKQALEKAIEIDPQCGVALSSLAQVYERLGEPERAASITQRAEAAPRQGEIDDPVMSELEKLGVSSGQVINRAESYARAGAAQQAVDELTAFTLTNPGRADAFIAKGQYQLQLFRFEEAMESFRQALAVDQNSVKARLGLADALRFARRNGEAIEAYRAVIERDRNIGEAYRGLGTCLLQQNELAGALAQFRKAVALLPDDVASRIALARLEFLEFSDQAVIDALKPIVEARDPSAPPDRLTIDAMLYTGLAHLRMGNTDEGTRFVNEALQAGADRPGVARELGEIGHSGMAVAILREAIERNPNDANAMMALAYELSTTPEDEVRDSSEALRIVDLLVQRNIGGFRAQEVRAFALADQGRFTEAVQTLEQALLAARNSAPRIIVEQIEERIAQFKRSERYRHALQLPDAE